MKRQGVLVYDSKADRMDIRFGLLDYYGGLHCGTWKSWSMGDGYLPVSRNHTFGIWWGFV